VISTPRHSLAALGLALSFLVAAPASAKEQTVGVLIDTDNDAATGCTVATADGPFAGVEQILETTVDTTPPATAQVTLVTRRECVSGSTFGAPITVDDGDWPVGVGLGLDGSDVVETYVPLSDLGSPDEIRVAVVSEDPDAMLVTSPGGTAPIVIAFPSLLEIPTVSEWGLLLLGALLAFAALAVLRRRGAAAALAAWLLLGFAGAAWAGCILDGQVGDWAGRAPVGEDAIGDGSPDLRALFAQADGARLCFRIDAFLTFNTAPVALDDTYDTDEDTPLAVMAPGVLGNDTDGESDPLTVTDHDPASAQGAVVDVNPDGSFTYDPTGVAGLQALDDGEMVDDTFTYTVSDGLASDRATVTVTVNGVNDAPTAMADGYETDEDVTLNVPAPGVLVNDDDADGDPLTAVLDTDVSNGTLTLNPDGSFTYTPDMDFNGTDSFTYHANDGTADSPTVTATITVGPVNDGPNAVDDTFGTDEDTVLVEPDPGVLTNDTDPENDPLTVTAFDATSAQDAAVTVDADGSFSYDPTGAAALQALDDSESVDDTFTYTVDDGSSTPDTATVTVTVDGVNDPPVAADDGYTTDEDVTLNVPAPGVLGNDTDVDVEPLTTVLVDDVSDGTLTLDADGSFTYTPDLNFNGSDSFTYRANDGTVGSNVATVTITVNPVNDPPLADDESISAGCNVEGVVETDPGQSAAASGSVFRTVADNVLDGDSDPVEGTAIGIVQADGLTSDTTAPFEITTNEGGSLTLHADGSFTYTPEGGDRSVADSFTYTIQDAEGAQDTATVTLNVGPICVWFVDNSVNSTDGDGDGTSSDPFSSLVDETDADALPDDAEDASQAGDVVYVFAGNSTTGDPYTVTPVPGLSTLRGYTAKADQIVLGEGVDLVVDLGSGPETLFDSVANERPVVEAPVDAFTVTDVAGVEIAGFEIDAGDNAVQVTATAGTVGLNLHDNTLSSTADSLRATTTGGTLELAIDDNTDITSDAAGVVLAASAGGTLYVTSFCGNSVHGDTVGTGVFADSVVFDANPADPDFTDDEVECGTGTTIGSAGNRVGGSGLVLTGVTGDLDLGQLDAWVGTAGAPDDTALRVIGSGAFNAGDGTGFQLTTDSGTLDSIDGPAVDIDPVSLETMVLTSVVSQNSDTVGIGLSDVSGSFQVTGTTTIGSMGTDGIAVTDSSVAMTFTGQLAIATAGDAGIELDALTGNLSVLDTTSSITGTTGDAFRSVDGRGAIDFNGSITNTSGNSVDLRNHGGGTLVDFDGFITDSGAGIFLDNSDQAGGATVSFGGGLDLDTGTNTAINATNGGTVNVTSGSVSTTADTTTGTVVQIENTTIGGSGVFFDSTSSTGGANGILLTNTGSGAFTANGGSIAGKTSRGLDVAGGSGNVTVAASIASTASGRSVEVTGHTGGTVLVSGAVTDPGLGIHLDSNPGAVLTFSGTLDLDTTTSTAFNATNGGTVNVTGAGNDVDTTTGIGVNIADTTIGASDVTFQSVSANGAPSGIVLDTTGASGGLVITGDGSNTNNASGGTIQNTTDHGIVATDTQDLSLSSIRIEDPGDAASEHGILATGLRGTNLLRASTITGFDQASGDGLRVINNSVNLTELRVDNSTFSASDGNDGVSVFAQGSSVMTVIVENQSLFTDLEGDAIDIIAGDGAGSTGTVNLTVDDNDFTNAGATGNGGIQARAAIGGTLTGSNH